jgi:hypothetical protein
VFRTPIIDGEIVALDEKGRSSFQLLQDSEMGEQRPPIFFYAFDLLWLNGKNLQNLPIEERKAKLEELLKKPPGVIRYSVSFTKDIPELLDRAHKLGLEGLIGKRAGSRYAVGKRTGAWIKLKLHQDKNLLSVGILNQKDLENILVRCSLASTKARNLNSAAGSGPALAISFCAVSILNCKRSGSIPVLFSTSRQLAGVVGTKG